MFTQELSLPETLAEGEIVAALDDVLAKSGLHITLRDTLAMYPGCTHWHLKHVNQTGTLELTWWPRARRCWFKVARNRRAGWMDAAMADIAHAVLTRARAAHAPPPAHHSPA